MNKRARQRRARRRSIVVLYRDGRSAWSTIHSAVPFFWEGGVAFAYFDLIGGASGWLVYREAAR